MTNFKKYSNKLIAVIITLILVISAFNIVSAATFKKVVSSQTTALPSTVNLSGKNNISKDFWNYAELHDTINGIVTNGNNNTANLNDANYYTSMQYGGFFTKQMTKFATYADGMVSYYLDGKVYLDSYYDLKDTVNLDYIVIGNDGTNELITGEYSVYIADSIDDLYKEENLYVTVDNKSDYEKGIHNRINVICFDKGNPNAVTSGRVIGIRIINPVCSTDTSKSSLLEVNENKNNIYPRISEFAVYGKYADEEFDPNVTKGYEILTDEKIASLKENYGESLLKDAPATGYIGDIRKPGLSNTFQTIANNSAKLNAVQKDIGLEFSEPISVSYKINGNSELMQVNGVAFRGINGISNSYSTPHYEVYVAESFDELYLPENKAYTYYAVTSGDEKEKGYDYITNGQLVEFNEPKYGNFIGFKIYEHNYTAVTYPDARISFIYAWGKEATKPPFEANALANVPATINYVNGTNKTTVSNSNLSVKEFYNITDGNKSTIARIKTDSSDRKTISFLYDMCSTVDLSRIELSTKIDAHNKFTNLKVYASTSTVKINYDSSLVWEYQVDSKGTVNKVKNININARYIMFVFEGAGEYITLNELAAIGQSNQVNVQKNLTGVIDNDNVYVYKTEISSGANTLITSNYDDRKALETNIYDTNPLTYHPLIGGTVGKHRYNIVVDLESKKIINEVNIDFLKNFPNYWPTKVNVYLSESDPFASGITPTFTISKDDIIKGNGLVETLVLPKYAQYLRIEYAGFTENRHYKDANGRQMISTVLAEIGIKGSDGIQKPVITGNQETTTKPNDYYRSIHTTDNRFSITPVSAGEFTKNMNFKVEDISATASQEEYLAVLRKAFGKKVAAFYNMELTKDNAEYTLNGTVNVTINLPDFILEKYTDLDIVYLDSNNNVTFLSCETNQETFSFETSNMGKFVIIGTALDGSSSLK